MVRKPGEPFNPFGLFNGIFVPEAICKYRGLSLGAKMVYGRLCRYAGRDGHVYPSMPTLASELGIGKTQARTYVHELEREAFIAVDRKHRHYGPSGTGGSNVYVFLWHLAFEGEQGVCRKPAPIRKTGRVPLRKTGSLALRNTGAEENHHQESHLKESQPGSAEELQLGLSEGKTPTDPPPIGVQEPGALTVDLSPWQKIRAEFRIVNGKDMPCQDERWLKENMELRNVTLETLLSLLSVIPFRVSDVRWLA